MPWIVLRNRLVATGDDTDWVGTAPAADASHLPTGISASAEPGAELVVTLGSPSGPRPSAADRLRLSVVWTDDQGRPVAGTGTVTLTPIEIVHEPTLGATGDTKNQRTVANAGTAISTTTGRTPITVPDVGSGTWSVRITGMTAAAGGTRCRVLAWVS